MDPVVSKPKKKDDFESSFLASVRDQVDAPRKKKQSKGLPEKQRAKVHAQRIRNAVDRSTRFKKAAQSDPSNRVSFLEQAQAIMANAIAANLRDLSRDGIDMTQNQYKAQMGIQ